MKIWGQNGIFGGLFSYSSKKNGGTAAMTIAPMRNYGESPPPARVSESRLRLAAERKFRALHTERIERAIFGIFPEAGASDEIRQALLDNLLDAIKRMPNPHKLGTDPKSAIERLLQVAEKSGVLRNPDGSKYECEWPKGKSSVEVLRSVYEAVRATMTGVSEQMEGTVQPFVEEMERLLQPLEAAAKAMSVSEGADLDGGGVAHGHERNTLSNVLAFECGVLVEGLTNVTTKELPTQANIARLEDLVEDLAFKAQKDRGHADLGELALVRTLSESERVMHLDDKLEDIAAELVTNLYEAGIPPDEAELNSLRGDLHMAIGRLQELASDDASQSSSSSAEQEALRVAVVTLNDYVALLTTWEKRLPKE